MRDDNSQQQIEQEEKMEMSGLYEALAKAQGELENATKSSENPFFKSKYADLSEVLNTIRPAFSKHGLSYVQFPGLEGSNVTLKTLLLHKSGASLENTAKCPLGGKGDAQAVGAAITYLRRYSLAAMAGISQEDDDGNSNQTQVITGAQADTIYKLVKESNSDLKALCYHYSIKSVVAMPSNMFNKVKSQLEVKLEKLSLEAHNDAAGCAE